VASAGAVRRRPAPGALAGLGLAALFALPLTALVVRAVADAWRAPAIVPQRLGTRGLEAAFSGQAWAAFGNSLAVAVTVTAVALALGWPAARALGERRVRRTGPVLLCLAMPLLVPSYATGTGLTEWFLRLGLADTLPGLALAHLVVVLPYVIIVLLGAFGPRVAELEEMGRTMGLAPLARFQQITLPAVRPTLAAAAFLGFLVSWSEYGASLAVGGGRPMLPVVLLPFVRSDPEVAAALSLLFLAPAVAALVAATRAARSPL
jgi:putative spermidine/putrescine transport system permease protein